ncbi:unnamed protein product [Arctogadus glacialis]
MNTMPTEPIKDYPIAKSLCQAGTPALLVDRWERGHRGHKARRWRTKDALGRHHWHDRADVISSRYWWKPRIATGIPALDSGKLSAAISSNVRISSLLLMASLTRSHVTDCSDSSPAAHQARSLQPNTK